MAEKFVSGRRKLRHLLLSRMKWFETTEEFKKLYVMLGGGRLRLRTPKVRGKARVKFQKRLRQRARLVASKTNRTPKMPRNPDR